MNFLAHMLLSCKDDEIMVGNFIADFITNSEQKLLLPNIKKGIDLHKKIDAFTDQHAQVKSAIALLRSSQGKYSPVVVDVLFDYFLTLNWHIYSKENLEEFASRIYRTLTLYNDVYPQKLKDLLIRMVEDDFLLSCKNEERLIKTFERIKKRAKFENNFHQAVYDLERFHPLLDHHFNAFFPEIIIHINQNDTC